MSPTSSDDPHDHAWDRETRSCVRCGVTMAQHLAMADTRCIAPENLIPVTHVIIARRLRALKAVSE